MLGSDSVKAVQGGAFIGTADCLNDLQENPTAKKKPWYSSIWPFGKKNYRQMSDDFTPIVVQDRKKTHEESKVDDVGREVLGIRTYAEQKYEEGLGYNLQASRFRVSSLPNFIFWQNQAIKAFLEAAHNGHGRARMELAEILRNDRKDLPRAIDHYKKLADLPPCPEHLAGHACYQLAVIYRQGGEDVPKDEDQAAHYYKMAIEKGCPIPALQPREQVLKRLKGSFPALVGYYKAKIELSPSPEVTHYVSYQLAEIYRQGEEGVAKDEAQAVHYYEIAVNEGFSGYAVYELALLLEKGGVGFKQDLKRAFDLLNSIADHHADAKCELARFYREGKHVEKDLVIAEKLYLDIAHGHKESAYQLGLLYESRTEAEGKIDIAEDYEKAKKHYQQAFLLHHPDAQNRLDRIAKAEAILKRMESVREHWMAENNEHQFETQST